MCGTKWEVESGAGLHGVTFGIGLRSERRVLVSFHGRWCATEMGCVPDWGGDRERYRGGERQTCVLDKMKKEHTHADDDNRCPVAHSGNTVLRHQCGYLCHQAALFVGNFPQLNCILQYPFQI